MTIAQLANLAIEHALTSLEQRELLEIHPRRREDLGEEILKAVLNAGDLESALSAALTALVESEKPEEVYGDDDELKQAFRDAFAEVEKAARENLEAEAAAPAPTTPALDIESFDDLDDEQLAALVRSSTRAASPAAEIAPDDDSPEARLLQAMEQLDDLDPDTLAALVDLSDEDLADGIFEDGLPGDEDENVAEAATAEPAAKKKKAKKA